jgi:GntR family transcriptional regulator
MHFSVDSSSPVSPSEQLIDQVRFAVAAGRLAPGQRLPSVRALASQVRVNPNTVGRAWRELEHDGVLEAKRGAGMFVAQGALDVCRIHRDAELAVRIGRAVAEARSAGVDAGGVLELVKTALDAWELATHELVAPDVLAQAPGIGASNPKGPAAKGEPKEHEEPKASKES